MMAWWYDGMITMMAWWPDNHVNNDDIYDCCNPPHLCLIPLPSLKIIILISYHIIVMIKVTIMTINNIVMISILCCLLTTIIWWWRWRWVWQWWWFRWLLWYHDDFYLLCYAIQSSTITKDKEFHPGRENFICMRTVFPTNWKHKYISELREPKCEQFIIPFHRLFSDHSQCFYL